MLPEVKHIYSNSEIVSTASTTKEAEDNSILPLVDDVNLGKNDDSFNSTNAQGIVEEQNKRTMKELYNGIEIICNKYNLDFNEAKNSGLLEKLLGKSSKDDLLDKNLVTQDDLNNAILKIEKAISAINEDIADIRNGKKKLSIDLIINYTSLLDGHVPSGWESIDKFREAQKKLNNLETTAAESITDRILRYSNKDISTMTNKNEIIAALQEYVKGHFNLECEKEGSTRQKVTKEQLRDFSKLVFNSTQEETEYLVESLRFLLKDNLLDGTQAIFDACPTQEKKMETASLFTVEKKAEIVNTPDFYGEKASSKIIEDFAMKTTSYKGEDAINQELDDIKKIAKDIAMIQEKLNNNQELTKEEEDFWNLYNSDEFHKSNLRGNILGIVNNQNVEETTIYQLLENTDNVIEDFYSNFKDDIYKNLEEKLESLGIDDEFKTNILNICLKNEYPEIKSASSEPSGSIDNIDDTAYGYPSYNNNKPDPNTSSQGLVNDFYYNQSSKNNEPNESNQSNIEETLISKKSDIKEYFKEYGVIKGFFKYLKENGSLAKVLNNSKNAYVNTLAINRYKDESTSEQVGILTQLDANALSLALEYSKNATIEHIAGITLDSYGCNKIVDEKVKEYNEKNKNKPNTYSIA